MKNFYVLFIVAAVLSFTGCYDDSAIVERLDKLENNKIASISEQINAITGSLTILETAHNDIKDKIIALEASDTSNKKEIDALKALSTQLGEQISALKSYVDDSIKSTKDWVSTTFATLEQYAKLQQSLTEISSLLQKEVKSLNAAITSLQGWVSDKLSGYYTIAEIDSKLAALKKDIDSADKNTQQSINSLAQTITKTKEEMTAAYQQAIRQAIEQNNGTISNEIATKIDAVNKRITEVVATFNEKIAKIEERLSQLEDDVKALLTRIQSISYIPRFSDEKALIVKTIPNDQGIGELDFLVSPKSAAQEIAEVWESALSVQAVETITRAVSFIDMPIIGVKADNQNGVITVTISGENLGDKFFNNQQDIKAALVISDGDNNISSDFITLVGDIDYAITDDCVVITYTTTDNSKLEQNSVCNAQWWSKIISHTYDSNTSTGVITLPAHTNIEDKAFFNMLNLKSISMDNNVAAIGNDAFNNCLKLENIKLSENITTIGSSAFENCRSLTSITIPDSVTEIGSSAFNSCSSLTSVTIPNSVTSIENSTFSGCSSLTSITIPDSVTKIGTSAFKACSSLTTITIPDSVTKIGTSAFKACSSLTSVTIGNSVTSIGENAFYQCSSLTSITIPDSVTSIGKYAFYDCSSLTSVTIPDSVTSIGVSAFNDCSSLTSITIPNSVTKIENSTFSGCSSLTSITIPDSVTEIGYEAFCGCSSLKEVYCKPTTPPTGGSYMFSYYNNSSYYPIGCKIYVPTASVSAYKAKEYWSNYAGYIVGYDF